MDEQEVERVAKLMHETHRKLITERDRDEAKDRSLPLAEKSWEYCSELYRSRILAVARVVIADLCGTPIIVTTKTSQ